MPSAVRSAVPGPSYGVRRVACLVAVIGAALLPGAPALAAGSVTVSPTESLDPTGQEIVVSGTGFDESQGIYVSVCVDNGPGELPTPCLGGPDTEGSSGAAAWISSNPPAYAEGLTIPYGPGGSFEVTLSVVALDPEFGIDCTAVQCSVVTRADHTATDDRSQDTRTPLSFGGAVSSTSASTPEETSADPPEGTTPEVTETTTDRGPGTTLGPADPPADQEQDTAADADGGGWPPALWVGLVVGVAAGIAASIVLVRRRTKEEVSR